MTKKGWRSDRRTKPVSIDFDPALYEAIQRAQAEGQNFGGKVRELCREALRATGVDIPPPIPAKRGPKPGKRQRQPSGPTNRGGRREGAGRPPKVAVPTEPSAAGNI
jgi:hypothetical protein